MSGLLPFALNRHDVWSPFAVQIHAAVWDRVGLERVQEYVRQWWAEWQESQSRYASKVAELRPEDPSCRSPEAPTLPLPSPKCKRSSAEKWAVLAAIHDVFWRDGEKINPWPEPKDGPAPKTDKERKQVLGVHAEWVKGGGFVYRQLLEQVLKLADIDLELAKSERRVLDRWLTEVAGLAVDLAPEEQTILETLAGERPMTVTQEALAGQTRLSDKTVRKYLAMLRERGFVKQPRGPKKGFAITSAGLAAIDRM